MKSPRQFILDHGLTSLIELFPENTFIEQDAQKHPELYIQAVLLCLQTFGSLPGTHGRTSVVKVLRGNSKLLSNPYHGVLAGRREIKNPYLQYITETIIQFLESCDACESDNLVGAENEYIPYWIASSNKLKNKHHIVDIANKLISAMAKEGIMPLTKTSTLTSLPLTNRELRKKADAYLKTLIIPTSQLIEALQQQAELLRNGYTGKLKQFKTNTDIETSTFGFIPPWSAYEISEAKYLSRSKDNTATVFTYTIPGWAQRKTDVSVITHDYRKETKHIYTIGYLRIEILVETIGTCSHSLIFVTIPCLRHGTYFEVATGYTDVTPRKATVTLT